MYPGCPVLQNDCASPKDKQPRRRRQDSLGGVGCQLGTNLVLNEIPPFADLLSKSLAVLWDVIQNDSVKQDRHGVEVTSENVCSDAKRFERNRTAPCERIYD